MFTLWWSSSPRFCPSVCLHQCELLSHLGWLWCCNLLYPWSETPQTQAQRASLILKTKHENIIIYVHTTGIKMDITINPRFNEQTKQAKIKIKCSQHCRTCCLISIILIQMHRIKFGYTHLKAPHVNAFNNTHWPSDYFFPTLFSFLASLRARETEFTVGWCDRESHRLEWWGQGAGGGVDSVWGSVKTEGKKKLHVKFIHSINYYQQLYEDNSGLKCFKMLYFNFLKIILQTF